LAGETPAWRSGLPAEFLPVEPRGAPTGTSIPGRIEGRLHRHRIIGDYHGKGGFSEYPLPGSFRWSCGHRRRALPNGHCRRACRQGRETDAIVKNCAPRLHHSGLPDHRSAGCSGLPPRKQAPLLKSDSDQRRMPVHEGIPMSGETLKCGGDSYFPKAQLSTP
jgi:hypothetical protein